MTLPKHSIVLGRLAFTWTSAASQVDDPVFTSPHGVNMLIALNPHQHSYENIEYRNSEGAEKTFGNERTTAPFEKY
jgi:hypothetical protein